MVTSLLDDEMASLPKTEETETGEMTPFLTAEQRAHLEDHGFLALPKLISSDTVAEIHAVLAGLFEAKAGYREGALFDLVGHEDDPDGPHFPSIFSPQNYAASLRKSEFFAHAEALARQLLGPEVRLESDLVLMKPAVRGPATPWHQDEAFRNPRFDYNELSVWMPLQDVDMVHGCMEFVPGTHRGEVLPHRTPNNDPKVHILECYEGFDRAEAVPCPIPAGGCTLHTGRTLHGAGPNRSDKPRYAYVLVFALPPTPASQPKTHHWLENKDTAHLQRMKRWLRRGGVVVALWREVKNTPPRDYWRVTTKMWRRAHGLGPLWKRKSRR